MSVTQMTQTNMKTHKLKQQNKYKRTTTISQKNDICHINAYEANAFEMTFVIPTDKTDAMTIEQKNNVICAT